MLENKCPLCGKVNPVSEWACESCGAELPAKQLQQGARPAPRPAQPADATAPRQGATQEQVTHVSKNGMVMTPLVKWGGGFVLAFWALVIMPSMCSVARYNARQAENAAPTPAPVFMVAPTPTPGVAAVVDPCGGATAICADGSKSYSRNRRGTCSHHGGVATWCN